MRIETRLFAPSWYLCACAGLLAVTCSGCDAEKIDNALGHKTKLSGPNTAIGGVNFHRKTGEDSYWDRHITSCRLNSGLSDISLGTGSGEPVITIRKDGDQVKVVLHGPDGTITFDEKQCSSVNLTLSPHGPGAPEMDGSASLDCKNEQGTLNSSVRFERCSR